MAPLPVSSIARALKITVVNISDLSTSTLQLGKRSALLAPASAGLVQRSDDASPSSAKVAAHLVTRTVSSTYIPCAGCKSPSSINNPFYFALFAILGVTMAVGSIWFFFHAKNGGFVWRRGDWEDYKSTVLRRRGPDGKLLSNATPSTKLGGGSIVRGYGQARWAAKSVVGRDERGRKGVLGKRGFGGSHSLGYSDNFTNFDGDERRDEMSEVASTRGGYGGGHHAHRYRDRDVREYRNEKVARVGGMNREADGSQVSYSDAMTERSTEPLVRPSRNTTNDKDKKRAKLERKAQEEAERMERKWRKEAERAAASLAKEKVLAGRISKPTAAARPAPAKATIRPVKPSATFPSAARDPSPTKREYRRTSTSRTPSPKKRDYSFSRGAGAADDLSTLYSSPFTASSGQRAASYYSEYRPHAQQKPRSSSRQASPTKKGREANEYRMPGAYGEGGRTGRGGRDVMAGYARRGADSLADSDED